MELTIVAATGGIGQELLGQAQQAGHGVTALVRSPDRLPAGVRSVQTDLSDPDPRALEAAVEGRDAVLSGLGPRARSDVRIASIGTRAILTALQATGVRRLVVVSAAPIGTVPSASRPVPPRHDPGEGVAMRHVLTPVLKRAFRGAYADLAEMEDLVRGSGLDWTVVRPPRLTGGRRKGVYRTASGQNLKAGLFISRADVAHLMLRVLDRPEAVKQTIGIAY